MSKPPKLESSHASDLVLWPLIVLYATARFLPLVADKVPISMIAALHIFPPPLVRLAEQTEEAPSP